MSYQALARKWRPQRFDELVGQEHIVRALQHALSKDRLHHALLFSGTRGVGKTTIGRLLAKGLNCEQGVTATPCGQCQPCQAIEQGRFVDLIEVDAASRTGVDDTRELMNNVQYAPAHGRYKVYLIDEVHMLSKNAFNALLKTLEEPPEHVRFLLATTDPQKLPITVLSRCLQFHLKRLPRREIQGRLEAILTEESVEFETGATELLARAADGSLRDGLSLLDQAIAFGDGKLQAAAVGEMLGSIARRDVASLVDAIAASDGPALMAAIDRLDEQAPDYQAALDELAAFLQRMALLQLVPEAVQEDEEALDDLRRLAEGLTPERVQLLYQIAVTGKRDLPLAPDPRSGFEMTLLRMLAFEPAAADVSASSGGRGPAPASKPTDAVQAAREALGQGRPAAAEPVAESAMLAAEPVAADPMPAAVEPSSPEAVEDVSTQAIPAVSPQAWAELVDSLGLSGLADQLARHCVWQGFNNNEFRLSLAPQYDSLFSAAHRSALIEALQKRFGEATEVQIESAESDEPTPAAMADDSEKDRQRDAVQALSADPNVQALSERFGARLHEGSVEALD